MTPEDKARQKIDEQLELLGWVIQDKVDMNRHAALGVAIREVSTSSGEVDYGLYIDGRAAGVIEAKRSDEDLEGIDQQSSRYIRDFDYTTVHWQNPLPFVYEATGTKIMFRDLRDPAPQQRRVFSFLSPESLLELLNEKETFRNRLQNFPPLDETGLRHNQISALKGLEQSLEHGRLKALIHAATGSGKTFTAVTACYRLIKHAEAKRILFLVDRTNLGIQAESEFKAFQPNSEAQKFTELYSTQLLKSNTIDPLAQVSISTIQRVYSIISNKEIEEVAEQASLFELAEEENEKPVLVSYNPDLPPDYFDLIIIDECHRSIYNKWRNVLDYFDAFLVGLTATPHDGTRGFFDFNLVSEYTHEDAVVDGVNVPYQVYRIATDVTEQGGQLYKVVESDYVEYKHKNRKTKDELWKQVEDSAYAKNDLDRSVVAIDQIRTVIKEFKNIVIKKFFPERGDEHIPKTLIFAKDDQHADNIRKIVLEEFAKPSEFCQKITYRADDPATSLSDFQFRFDPRIVVTVDMISTGTDIKPLEVILFMRDVKSLGYYEQMKGRGVRVIKDGDFQSIVGEAAKSKDYFILVDAVGVTQNTLVESGSTETQPSIPLKKLLDNVAQGKLDPSTLSTLATRLIRIEKRLSPEQRTKIQNLTGKDVKQLAKDLFEVTNPDYIVELAKKELGREDIEEAELNKIYQNHADQATRPFANPDLRKVLMEKPEDDIVYDHITKDTVIYSGVDTEKAKGLRMSFNEYLVENRDKLIALQVLYNQPYADKNLTLQTLKDLEQNLKDAKFNTNTMWSTIAQLEPEKVTQKNPTKQITDLVSLIRFEIGKRETLLPFQEEVSYKLDNWIELQENQGVSFNEEQKIWLKLIAEQIATSLEMTQEDFKHTRFKPKGGIFKAVKVFETRDKLFDVVDELNKELTS